MERLNILNKKSVVSSGNDENSQGLSMANLIVENGSTGIAIIDDSFQCIYVNKAMAAISGRTVHELMGYDIRNPMDKACKDQFTDWINQIKSHRDTSEKCVICFNENGGELRRVETTVVDIKTDDLQPLRVLYSVDISDHKHMGEELAESERKYRLLVENIEEFFFEQSIEGGFIFFNEAVVRHSGFSRDELNTMNFRDYILPEDWDRVVVFYANILETGEPASGLLIRGRMKDGSVHYYEVKSNLKTNDTGEKVGFRSYSRDVTAEIRYEKELKESEQQLKAIIEGSPIPTIVVNKNHCIVHWNKACEELTGVQQSDIIGKDKQITEKYLKQPILSDFLIDGLPLEDISAFYKSECRKSGVVKDAYDVEAHFPELGENGKWLYLTSAFLRDSENTITGAIETLLDITVKKRAEEDMIRMHWALEEKVIERTRELQDINTALEVLLKKRENDKRDLENRVTFSIKEVIAPHIDLLKKTPLDKHQKIYLEILEQNFMEICSPFMQILSESIQKLTPTEIQVVNLIKQNKSSKVIADFLGISPRTVEFHRDNIRKKLGIKNKKLNLRTYLLSDH
ncbi:MAG: PAS domain S-box protein [Proteobacteria bacterium]|nr:PAS domain S-box protein [Pseudomonadota bacterium]